MGTPGTLGLARLPMTLQILCQDMLSEHLDHVLYLLRLVFISAVSRRRALFGALTVASGACLPV